MALWAPALLLFLYVAGAWLPVIGAATVASHSASGLEAVYGTTCHQIPSRTFTVTGTKLAFCARCLGFYGAFAVVSLLVAWFRSRRGLGVAVAAMLTLPVIVDLLLSYADTSGYPNLLRTLSGSLAGAAIGGFAYPRYITALYREAGGSS